MTDQRFGAVAIIGATNAGKSTLTNAMVGEKVAITSRKVQTTRFQIRGIVTHDTTQMVLVDTPGFFQPRRQFDRMMIASAWQSLEDVEVVAFLIDASKPYAKDKQHPYLDKIKELTKPEDRILILNKVDQAPRDKLMAMAKIINDYCDFDQTFMVSALTSDGVGDVINYCASKMPEGEWVYDADDLTTISNRLLAAEITREKIYDRLHQELPYHIAIETEAYGPSDNGKGVAIEQVVIIEDQKHKGIVLGKQGQTLKIIGQAAREELAGLLGCPVHLKLYVQHRKNWLESPEALRIFND